MSAKYHPETHPQYYIVNLTFRIEAEEPEEAVEQFIDLITYSGLRTWEYKVENEEFGLAYFVDGTGKIKHAQPLADSQRFERARSHNANPQRKTAT